MTIRDILDAINLKLCELYEDFKIYVKFQAQGFQRPAFFCEFIRDMAPERLNKSTYLRRLIFQLIYFAPTDDYYRPDRLGLYDISDNILDAFSDGYILVLARAPMIDISLSEVNGREAYFTVQVSYAERTAGARLAIADEAKTDRVEEIILNERGFESDSSD